jgi:hypothetical protein
VDSSRVVPSRSQGPGEAGKIVLTQISFHLFLFCSRNLRPRRRFLPSVTRYFFHLKSGFLWEDEDGCELTDLEAARKCAVQRARAICRTRLMDPDDVIQVTTDDGAILFAVSFGEASAHSDSSTLH